MPTIKTKPPKSVTSEVINRYVALVKEGRGPKEIQEALGMNGSEYKQAIPFLRQGFEDATRADSTSAAGGQSFYLSFDGLKDKFLKYIQSGLSVEKALRITQVPEPVFSFWRKDKNFLIRQEYAKEIAIERVERALYRRAVGFEHDASFSVETETEGTGEHGAPFGSKIKTTTKKRKVVYPDVRAIETYLYNRAPDRWQPHGLPGEGGSKGRIVEFLDELCKEGGSIDD
jgi:hypothetical protein